MEKGKLEVVFSKQAHKSIFPLKFFTPILCFLFLCGSSFIQYHLLKALPGNYSFISSDKFGNIYAIKDNQLLKYDSQGAIQSSYKEFSLGKLQTADATNPLKLLLFFPDFAQINVLDNKLALQAEIQLRSLDIQQPLAICRSYNEGIWVFDMQDFQLKRINPSLQVTNESGNLNQALGYSPTFDFMVEEDSWLYANNPETGILVFDIYGTYYKTIALKNLHSFQIRGNKLFYLQKGKIATYDLKTIATNEIEIPSIDSTATQLRVENQQLFLLKKDSLKIYRF